MPKIRHYKEIRIILIRDAAWRRKTIKFNEVEEALGKKIPRDHWCRVLDAMAFTETRRTGHDLTKVLVFAAGKAKGLPRYFSDIAGGQTPGSTPLDPQDANQVAAYRRELEELYDAYQGVAL